MSMRSYTVAIEVKAENKFSKRIYAFDFFFLIGVAFFSMMTKNLVAPQLQLFYHAFNGLTGIYLSRKSKLNPGKRVYQSFIFYLLRPKVRYKEIEE